MKTLPIGLLVGLAIDPCAHAIDAADYVISCPATIETTQKLRNPSPAGWLQVSDVIERDSTRPWQNTHRLQGISFSTGHPSDLVTLVPDNPNEYGRGRKFVQRWSLLDSTGLYATCFYDGTTVQLTQLIPSGYNRCEVWYTKSLSTEVAGSSCVK